MSERRVKQRRRQEQRTYRKARIELVVSLMQGYNFRKEDGMIDEEVVMLMWSLSDTQLLELWEDTMVRTAPLRNILVKG